MSSIILCNLSDANQCINEVRLEWIYAILESLGISAEIYASDLKVYREKMAEEGIEVDLVTNGDVNVYKQTWHEDKNESGWLPSRKENLIAQWKEPARVIKVDGKETYYEIHLDEWSILNTRK
jgi:hypothetical protein